MSAQPECGIAITTAELATKGVEPVLDAIAATGATAITTSTSIVVEAPADTGLREPSIDVAGHARMLDRPIWGKRVAHIHHYAGYPPDPGL